MASQRRSPKNGKASIRCWWIPLEVQSFEPENALPNGKDINLKSNSHSNSSKQPETKSSTNKVSTSQFVSALAGVWDYVGQTEDFETKSRSKYGEIFLKENIICSSDIKEHKWTLPVDGGKYSNDLASRSFSSSSAKSDFEDLRTMKRILCFASCSRNVNNLSILSDSNPDAESSGLDKVASIGFASIRTKLGKIGSYETEQSSMAGKNQITIESSNRSSMTKDENSSCGQNVNLVENAVHSPDYIYTTHSLESQPVTNTKESINLPTSPSFGLHSDHNRVIISAEWALGQCQQSTDSSCINVESTAEVMTSETRIIHENCNSIIREVVVDEGYTKNWPPVQDKLQLAFARNRHALAGAFAGTLVSLCLHPVDTVKTVIQANGGAQKSSYDTFRTIISQRGVFGLYRGIASNIASAAPISAIYTYTYESVKGALLPILPKEYHSFAHCIAGGCSSVATSFIFTPSERIKQQMQVGSQYQNCWNALIGCLEKGGVPSLYAGWGAVLCRNIPHSIIKFYTYESLKQLCLGSSKPNASLGTLQTLVCGGLAGSTAALFTTPFDVVKTRLQTQVPGSLVKYEGVLHALQEIARAEGLQGLYKGLTPRLAMYVSQGAIFFASYEFLKAVFSLETSRERSKPIESKLDGDHSPSRFQKLNS